MGSKRARIGKRTVDAVSPPESGEVRLWDDDLTGFCLRAYKGGRKVYAVKYRVNGRQRWFTIGEHGAWAPDQAREKAAYVLRRAAEGVDPQGEKIEARRDMLVSELIDLYLADGPATKPDKRASSWATDRSNLTRHVKPLLGERRAGGLSKADITKMLKAVSSGETARDEKTKSRGRAIVKGGAGVAPRVLTSLRAMFAWATEHRHHLGANPCAGVKLPPRPTVERFLSPAEAAKLFDTLSELEARGEIASKHGAIFRLLLLTGARRNEIAALRWSEVDLERDVLTLPPERTKAGGKSGDRRIPLNSLAAKIIARQPRAKGALFVFPADKGESGHTTTVPKVWREKVRPAAALPGLRIHDLRHSFASFALADGASLALIGRALGHANFRSTERYSHVKDDPLRALSEGVATRLGRDADG